MLQKLINISQMSDDSAPFNFNFLTFDLIDQLNWLKKFFFIVDLIENWFSIFDLIENSFLIFDSIANWFLIFDFIDQMNWLKMSNVPLTF